MSPLERLRRFFGEHQDLKFAATQAGLARLIGKSETLIRSLERGRAKVSHKVANQLSAATGCHPQWLLDETVEEDCPIPTLGGGQLHHLVVLDLFARRIESNLEQIQPPAVALDLTKRRMLDALLGMVAAEVLQFWDVPDDVCPDPVPELLEWLRNRSKIRCWHTMARSQSAQTRGGGNDNPEMS